MGKKIGRDELELFGHYIENTRNFDPLIVGDGKVAAILAERLAANSLSSAAQYVDLLEVRPAEFPILLDLLFSDQQAFVEGTDLWNYLENKIIPSILAADQPVRTWCVGCKTGYEAYVLAMLLCERMDLSDFQKRVKIFVTDIDEDTLSIGRQAGYDKAVLDTMPQRLANKYFINVGNRYQLQNEVRRVVIFGKHDVLTDPHISKMDLVVCFNVLPYFDAEKQKRIICDKLRVALKPKGYLLIGNGESINAEYGLLACGPGAFLKTRDTVYGGPRWTEHPEYMGTESGRHDRLHEFAFDNSPTAHIVLDDQGAVALVNAQARIRFGLSGPDIGRPLRDLEISYRPAELRSLIEEAMRQSSAVSQQCSRVNSSGQQEHFDVLVRQVDDSELDVHGVSVQYVDVTTAKAMKLALVGLNQQLQTANEELQSAHEELETANEELQSTNEELETTNEELQSTNEELETINEELQSTNSELESTNSQQRLLSSGMNRTNELLEAVLGSMRSAVIVLNANLQVLIWNRRASDLWGLRFEEVFDQNFFGLDIGLPVDQLVAPLRQFQGSDKKMTELSLSGRTRTGKDLRCDIRLTRVSLTQSDGIVLIINDVSLQGTGAPDGII